MILIPLTLPRTRNPLELCRMLVLARRDRVVLEYLPLVKAIAVRIAASVRVLPLAATVPLVNPPKSGGNTLYRWFLAAVAADTEADAF